LKNQITQKLLSFIKTTKDKWTDPKEWRKLYSWEYWKTEGWSQFKSDGKDELKTGAIFLILMGCLLLYQLFINLDAGFFSIDPDSPLLP